MSEEQTFIELPERNNLYEVDEELEEGAKLCEKFLLLPDRYKDRETKVRLMLRNKFGSVRPRLTYICPHGAISLAP